MNLVVIAINQGDDDNISKIKMFHQGFYNKEMAQPTQLPRLSSRFL